MKWGCAVQEKKKNQTLLLDLCSVLGRDSWLSAIPTVPDTWLTLSLVKRDSEVAVGKHPQEVVWLRSESIWNRNSSFHSWAGTTTLSAGSKSYKPRIHHRDTITEPSAPGCFAVCFSSGSSPFQNFRSNKRGYWMYRILVHLWTAASWAE